jgi:hypothetical protein
VDFRFISVEQGDCRFGTSICFPVRDREDIIILTTRKTDERRIRQLLAEFNHGDHYHERLDEIEIVVGEPVRARRGGIPDSREYSRSRRSLAHPNPFTDEPVGDRWEKVGRDLPDERYYPLTHHTAQRRPR